jgi:hypothetical protein
MSPGGIRNHNLSRRAAADPLEPAVPKFDPQKYSTNFDFVIFPRDLPFERNQKCKI